MIMPHYVIIQICAIYITCIHLCSDRLTLSVVEHGLGESEDGGLSLDDLVVRTEGRLLHQGQLQHTTERREGVSIEEKG
jgi:hypothetical protein